MAFDATMDLRPLSHYLWTRKIAHRISEQSGEQVVWVESEEIAALARDAYARFEQDRDAKRTVGFGAVHGSAYDAIALHRIGDNLTRAPVVAILILLSLTVTALQYTHLADQVYAWLRVGSPAYMVESSEYWRVISPIFLHFSLMHLAFNLLLLWVFGQQIERRESSRFFIVLVILFAAVSNITQYWITGSNFGGMSGVVYGILGYCWLWGRLRPSEAYAFPNALMGFMLAWLALGFTDITQVIGFGRMANGAHLSGLMMGLVGAFAASILRKKPAGS